MNGEERLKVTGVKEDENDINKLIVTVSRDKDSIDFKKSTTGKLVLPPDEWFCPKSWWGSQNGCNCECGSWDPDCADEFEGTVQGEVKGCDGEKPFCSVQGRCMQVDPRFYFSDNIKSTKLEYDELYTITPKIVALTMEDFDNIKKPGEIVLDGFLGSSDMLDEEFHSKKNVKINALSCPPCPNDVITNGLPLKSQTDQKFYCNLRVEGFFPAYEQPPMEFENIGKKMKPLNITINNVVGRLPTCVQSDNSKNTCKNMKIELSSYDLQNKEKFEVMKVENINSFQQRLLLKFDRKLETTRMYHLSAGYLITAIDSNTELIYVDTMSANAGIKTMKQGCSGYKCPNNERQFNKKGPYLVDVEGLGDLVVSEAYTLYKGPYWDVQVLKLAQRASFLIGLSSYFTKNYNTEVSKSINGRSTAAVVNAGFFGALFGRVEPLQAGVVTHGELNSSLGITISKVSGPSDLGHNILRVQFPIIDMSWALLRSIEGKVVHGENSGARGKISFAGKSFRTGENVLILYNTTPGTLFEADEILLDSNGQNILGNQQEITVDLNMYKMEFTEPATINYSNETDEVLSQSNGNDTKVANIEQLHERAKTGNIEVTMMYFSSKTQFDGNQNVYYNGHSLGIPKSIKLVSAYQKSAPPWECPIAYFNDVSFYSFQFPRFNHFFVT